MLSIGAFAQIGQVTHRMLRHWDTAGLLVPAHVDEHSGYRSYDPSQLERLHRIVALRQLGFGLDDVASILNQGVGADRIAVLLRERRVEVEREHRIAAARLVDVERRLHLIEREKHMREIEIVQKSLPALRLAARRRWWPTARRWRTSSDRPSTPSPQSSVRRREHSTPRRAIRGSRGRHEVIAGYLYLGTVHDGIEIVELPAVEMAVCGIHLGSMERIGESWQSIHARRSSTAGTCHRDPAASCTCGPSPTTSPTG